MLESVPIQEGVSKKTENDLEIPDHVDVSKVTREKNAFFVHMIQVTNDLDVSENNKSLNTKKLSVADKLDIVYGTSPTLSASTLRPHTKDKTFMGGFGVIFSHGEIEHASPSDAGTKALTSTKRHIMGGIKKGREEIERAVDREHGESSGNYNEIVLKNPDVAGGFMKLASYKDRISYSEEESTYYDNEKTITKVGVIDMANKLDRFGRSDGSNYDRPFGVLEEMSKRGKVFVMDEENQMYVVRSVDPVTRKIEFIANPIEPKDFAFYYGKERMNKYQKQEMRDRLAGSLQEKGLSLH